MKQANNSTHRWAASAVKLSVLAATLAGCATDAGTDQMKAGQWQPISATVTKDVWADKPNNRMVHRFIVAVYQKATIDTLKELEIDHQKVAISNPGNPVITGNPADLSYSSIFQIAGEQFGCPSLPSDKTRLTNPECTVTIRLGGMDVSDSAWTLTPDGHHAIRVSTPKATKTLEDQFYKALNRRLPQWTAVKTESQSR